MSHLITNIGSLVTNSSEGEGLLGEISQAALLIEEGKVAWLGRMADAPEAMQVTDVAGAAVIPGFVDSHAHLVFAGDRALEFEARMSGQKYAAGGIKTTVAATRAATDDQLRANVKRLSDEMLRSGITTFECKSGYGLTVEDELRSIRIAKEFTDEVTLLAAHVVPFEFSDNRWGYVESIIHEMLPAAQGIARWVDVFCDEGAFTSDETGKILFAAKAMGFDVRLHANQLKDGAGVKLAVEFDAASADHCTHLTDEDTDLLAQSKTVVTLLPGAEFSTRSKYPDARKLLDRGITLAIATDCNPGSSYTTSMPFNIAVAVREMHMTPAEAVRAATYGGALALRRSDVGHLSKGANADFVVLDAPSYVHLSYRPGVDVISSVWKSGTERYSKK
ncbi:MAG: imidazolonepropionase [Actinomycetota bacterium]